MAKKIIKKKKPSYNLTEMQNKQQEFALLKENMKLMKKREDQLKAELDAFMTNTLETDAKGHRLFTVVNERGEKVHLQKQARKKVSLNTERAIEYLNKSGHTELVEVTTVIAEEVTQDQIIEVLDKKAKHLLDTKVVVDEVGLEQAVINEEIPMDEFESICDIELSYAMAFVKDIILEEGE